MEYKNVHIIYFSPTHTSAKTAYAIAEGLSGDVLLESDITMMLRQKNLRSMTMN